VADRDRMANIPLRPPPLNAGHRHLPSKRPTAPFARLPRNARISERSATCALRQKSRSRALCSHRLRM
jgi:hypothetical protein